MASTALTKLKSIALTGTGAIVGALAGGPVGMAVGTAGGGLIDFLRAKMAKPTLPVLPPVGASAGATQPMGGTPGLPPTTDMAAATSAVHLLLLGKPNEKTPAAYWLQKFQASAGLPATGKMDPTTRQMLQLATAGGQFDASRLPPITILG